MSFESSLSSEPSGAPRKVGEFAVVQFSRWGARVVGTGGLIVSGAVAASLLTWSFTDPSLERGRRRNAQSARLVRRDPLRSVDADARHGKRARGAADRDLGLPGHGDGPPRRHPQESHSDPGRRIADGWRAVVAADAGAMAAASRLRWHPRRCRLAALVSLLSAINAERAPAAAGLFYVAGGLAALAIALGISQREFVAALEATADSVLQIVRETIS